LEKPLTARTITQPRLSVEKRFSTGAAQSPNVNDARARVAQQVSLPAGYYVAWSGRWENQEHARRRLQLVLPIVLLVIFVLLYLTYHSVAEAAHVLLAVPFALTGGVYLL